MPIYEYQCQRCEKDVELLVQRHDEVAVCPACGSNKMTKLLSVIGSPVVGESASQRTSRNGETCGRPECGRGCAMGQ